MRSKLMITALAAVATGLCAAAPAGATTFCVPDFHAGCPDNGGNVAEADLQTAMQTNGNDGAADTVLIAPGTVTDPNTVEPAGNDPLLVRGAGAEQTRVTSSTTANAFVVNLAAGSNGREITIKDLTIQIPASMPDSAGAGVQMRGDTLDHVDIESLNPGSEAIPSWVLGGAFRNGEIRGAGAGYVHNGIQVGSPAGDVTVEGATIRDAHGAAIVNQGAAGTLSVRRTRIVRPGQTAITATAGTTAVENAEITTDGASAIYVLANSAADAQVHADHVTAVETGSVPSAAAVSQTAGGQPGSSSVSVTNSILRGYSAAYLRQSVGTGSANLAIRHSNVHVAGTEAESGSGTLQLTDDIDADPMFVSASDLSLRAGSPSIDAGDPGPGGAVEDILGAPRPIDGDAVPGAVRDQGAYEFIPPAPPADPPAGDPAPADVTPPETLKRKGPKRRISKRRARFAFTSEPGAGFLCSIDGGTPRACTSPAKVGHLKRGRHKFRVAAVDAAGNVDPTPVRFSFRVVRR